MRPVYLLELNEINFDYLRAYGKRLPNIKRLVDEYGVAKTTSEDRYEDIEPWIQWITAHTGLPLDKHRVFRLGDIRNRELRQIWEVLEDAGLSVGAISPMNATDRTRNAAFFVPDPWTQGKVTGPAVLERLYSAVAQAVNDNAQSHLTVLSLLWLLAGLAAYAAPRNYGTYLRLSASARSRPWTKAMLLDLLLADVFVREVQRNKPDFASLFLNAGAHIQHHYMFNSEAYDGGRSNPEWYCSRGHDPLLDVYRLYDSIVGQIRAAFPDARLMIATGLHQVPHPEVTYYWRLKDHTSFLKELGVAFTRVEPRMSRDFLIVCDSAHQARNAETILRSCRSSDGLPLFEVDNRGNDLFVMFSYPNDIADRDCYTVGERQLDGLRRKVAFVAIKNGQHDGTGYFLDTCFPWSELKMTFPLQEVPRLICEAFHIDWTSDEALPENAANEAERRFSAISA